MFSSKENKHFSIRSLNVYRLYEKLGWYTSSRVVRARSRPAAVQAKVCERIVPSDNNNSRRLCYSF